MRRCALLIALLLCLGAAPPVLDAQPGKLPRIGVISGEFPTSSPCLEALRRGLAELGYVEGRTHVLEVRWSEGRVETFPSLAAELVRLNVDLIVSTAGPAALAVKEASPSIPIVLASSFYPVELGVIASLAHPGGNVTGVVHFTPELMAKRVQLLKEAVPTASRFAVLRMPGRVQDLVVRDMETAARQPRIQIQAIEVRRAEDFPGAFETAVRGRAHAVLTTQAPLFFQHSAQLALKRRLPSLSGEPNAADAGMLLFYGPDVIEGCQRAAKYVDRVLRGTKPADLPVEQASKIELVINLGTAKAISLKVPQALLLRADRLIQ